MSNSNRLVVLTSFVAFFAGSFLDFLWHYFNQTFPSAKKATLGAICVLLAVMTFQNFYTYFVTQADNPECRLSLGLEQFTVGQSIHDLNQKYPNQFHFFITPFYYGNHTVRFLAYPALEKCLPLDLTALAQGNFPKDKNAVFFLEQNKTGAFSFLKVLFPKGQETLLKNSDGHILLYRYDVSQEALEQFKKWNRGLTGTYWDSLEEHQRPVLVRQDPVLNFTSKHDFPFQKAPPFLIRWKGRLNIHTPGTYQIRLLTTDQAHLWIDGKDVFSTQNPEDKAFFMKRGLHSIGVDYEKMTGDTISANLIWMPPSGQWEAVPPTAFGLVSTR